MGNVGDSMNQTFDSGRLSHAYIACGETVDTLAMAVVCSSAGARPCMSCVHCVKASRGLHQDVVIVGLLDKKREILVDQIRELKKDVIVTPGEASRKAYIINDADAMNTAAQNAFLRILEEPPGHVTFILNTENPAALLQTVRSRCIEIKGKIVNEPADAGTPGPAEDFFLAIGQGNERLIRLMFRLEKLERNEFALFLSSAYEQVTQRLRIAAADGDITGAGVDFGRVERALRKAMECHDMNVNAGHIAGMLCSEFMKEVEF